MSSKTRGNDLNLSVPLEDSDAVAAADAVRDFCSKAPVVHEQEVEFADVVDHELFEAVGEEVARLYRGHQRDDLARLAEGLC